ncbi:site-specific integrase [Micromonospora sp. NPDC051296]|uniref:site-specific integrase n=1 Tax=Micromonospora sp. NPDC051296 TaxID=3155046 RepID=UPI003444CF77
MPGYGTTLRTPVSRRDPGILTAPAPIPAPPPLPNPWDRAEIEDVVGESLTLSAPEATRVRRNKQLASRWVLQWLQTLPADTWQQRWLLGGDPKPPGWVPEEFAGPNRWKYFTGAGVLIVLGVIRPSYLWLFGNRPQHIYDSYRRRHQSDVFAEVEGLAAQRGGAPMHAREALTTLTRMVIVTGKDLRELSVADLTGYAAARTASGRYTTALPFAYDLLRAVGGLADAPPTFKQASARGQLTVAELVDRYPIAYRPMRDVLVHYLAERAPALDYNSLATLSQILSEHFWADLERHHPGIDSLRLPPEAIHAWKQRIRVLPDGSTRLHYEVMLLAVRAFYLDLQHWAMEQPELWAAWSAPCPITAADLRGTVKEKRRRQARMHERTRTLAPLLPRVVTAAERQLDRAARILTATRATAPGEQFTVDGTRYLRTGKPNKYWQPTALLVRPIEPEGPRFDAAVEEDQAFWVWAAVEVLRRTGARIEEMLELTHLSLRQYQAPTGDLVPLIQISPSKTDHERVIPADPDLVAVLARIIRRIKGPEGRVPLLQRYDFHDRRFGPPLPHLFQRVSLGRLGVISPTYFNQLFKKLAKQAALTDVDGSPISFSAHDFRRVFATETVNSGLPIHIAAKLLGHLDLNTTQGYVAVYPEEVIRHYRTFIDQGRGRRPRDEYREPTNAEWAEFRDHFQLRKVALGTCERPYGTPCQHEHACIRCPVLRLDLAQVPRLLQIETNTHERLDEARRMQWLGEVAALEESLRHISGKKQQVERLRQQTELGESGSTALG